MLLTPDLLFAAVRIALPVAEVWAEPPAIRALWDEQT